MAGRQRHFAAPNVFVPVDIRSLADCRTAMCDLYRFTSQHGYVLFLSRDAEFGEHVRDQLTLTKARRLYVRVDDADEYAKYLAERAAAITTSVDIPPSQRAETAYQAVHFLADRLQESPTSETYQELVVSVKATVSLVLADASVTYALLAHTRQGSYMYNHAVNVGIYGTALASLISDDRAWLNSMGVGLCVHDVGKTRLPAEVLAWPGEYSEADWAIMKQHPGLGLVVLSSIGETDPVVQAIVAQHHERDDGSGYPRGLTRDQITLEARICAMADTFDSLTSNRTYRAASTTYEGLDSMIREMSGAFDSSMLASFVTLFREDALAPQT